MVEGDLILKRFLIGERIGQGGFGVVHRAFDQLLHRPVAVKEIVGGDEERVQREAQAAGRLSHQGIVMLFELGRDGTCTYLVSELVEGTTLRGMLDQGSLTDRDVAVVGAELCSALAHAHERGVVHRDLKPENVIIAAGDRASGEGRGQVKLMDFGIAAIAGAPTLTAAGQMVGTIAYIAPEQAEGGLSGPHVDVYALALNLYECWSGTNPVLRESAAATARAIGTRVPTLAGPRPDLPHEVIGVIDACLDPDPRRRPSLSELAAPLREVEAVLDSQTPLPALAPFAAPATAGASPHRGRGSFVLPAILLTAAVAIGLALIGLRGAALVAAVLMAPALLLIRSPGAWLVPVIAPALASVGLLALYPVVAAVVGRTTPARLVLGAVGMGWVLVGASLFGLSSPLSALPGATGWASSADGAASALVAAVTAQSVALVIASALATATLGGILSLRVLGLRPVIAIVWAAGFIASLELIFGPAFGATGSDAGPLPIVLAASVLGVVAVTIIRDTRSEPALEDRHTRRGVDPVWSRESQTPSQMRPLMPTDHLQERGFAQASGSIARVDARVP